MCPCSTPSRRQCRRPRSSRGGRGRAASARPLSTKYRRPGAASASHLPPPQPADPPPAAGRSVLPAPPAGRPDCAGPTASHTPPFNYFGWAHSLVCNLLFGVVSSSPVAGGRFYLYKVHRAPFKSNSSLCPGRGRPPLASPRRAAGRGADPRSEPELRVPPTAVTKRASESAREHVRVCERVAGHSAL